MSGEIDQGGDGQCSSSEPVGSGDAGIDTGSKLRFSENVDELIAYLKSHPMFIDHTPTVEEIENNTLLQVNSSIPLVEFRKNLGLVDLS